MKAVKVVNRKKTVRRFTPVTSMRHFSEKIAVNGDTTAFMWFDGKRVMHSLSYAGLSDLIKNTAAGLSALGYKNNRIAVIGETSVEWVATYAATVASGNIVIPMDKELKIEEIEGFLEFAEADAIVFSKSFNEKFANAAANHKTVTRFIPLDIEGCPFADSEKVTPFSALVEKGIEAVKNGYELPKAEDLDRMAVMLFTSGTTGTSKCVMLSERNVVAALNAACACVNFCPEDTIVSVLPLHHTYELCCLMAGLNYGMHIGINDSLKRVIKNFEAFKPTGLVLVPLFVTTMNKKVWDEAKKTKRDRLLKTALKVSKVTRHVGIDLRKKLFADVNAAFGGNLCKIVCGGAPLNPSLVECFEEFGVTISEGYGITECSPLISVNPYYASKSGSVGPAVDCCRVRIDSDHVNDKGYNEGEILVKGDNVMLGYYKNPEETAKVFTEDGWFRTGDEGYIDEDGYIFITGRKKFVIVLENGKNVFPEEIEEYLGTLSSIAECVVVGRKKKDSDAVVLTAIVYPNFSEFAEGTPIEQVTEAVKEQINKLNHSIVGYKQIRAVEIRTTEFEKTTSRKIKRHLIK